MQGSASGPSASPEWETVLAGDWTIEPGEEYICVRQTIDQATTVAALEAIAPLGTHHTLLTMGQPSGPDGTAPCSAFENHAQIVFASGVGTNRMTFPEGVALEIPAGTQLLLNLHLFNTSAEALSGTSGTRMQPAAEEDVQHLAESVLGGTAQLDIPPQQDVSHVGGCVMSHDFTVFAVAPHMHQLGVHMKVVAESALLGDVVLVDEPYSFDEQIYYMIDPIEMSEGENIRVECTHRNTTNRQVGFGDSSLDEMCFAGLFRYPARGSFLGCAVGAPQG